MMTDRILQWALVMFFMAIAACTGNEQAKNSGQVVAKVNGEEISVHQLNFLLSQTPGVNKDNLESAKKQALDSLVEQALLDQQAVTDKLDRNPQVMMAVEQNKRQILAKAWLENAVQSVTKPSAQEISQYYREHPDLFARHKTFRLKEVLIGKTPGQPSPAESIVSASHQLDEAVKMLDAEKIDYQLNIVSQAAENLPLEQLPALSALAEGQFIVVDNGNALLLICVLATKEDVVEPTKAQPLIEAFLMNKQRKALLEKVLAELKAKAKIDYLGGFAGQANVPASSATGGKDPAKQEIINKGMQGL